MNAKKSDGRGQPGRKRALGFGMVVCLTLGAVWILDTGSEVAGGDRAGEGPRPAYKERQAVDSGAPYRLQNVSWGDRAAATPAQEADPSAAAHPELCGLDVAILR